MSPLQGLFLQLFFSLMAMPAVDLGNDFSDGTWCKIEKGICFPLQWNDFMDKF